MTLVVPARNATARPFWKLAQLLASLSRVQSLFGGLTADQSLAKIHWPWADDRIDPENADATQPYDARPRIIIEHGEQSIAKTGEDTFEARGTLNVSIEQLLRDADGNWPSFYWPAGYNPGPSVPVSEISQRDQVLAADNVAGGIIAQMMSRANKSPVAGDVTDALSETFLDVRRYRLIVPTSIQDAEQWQGAYFAATSFAVEYLG